MGTFKITLIPTLVSNPSFGQRPWINNVDSATTASEPGEVLGAAGGMGVQLPDESIVKSLRITGNKDTALAGDPGELNVTLFRKGVADLGAAGEELVVRVSNPPVLPQQFFDHTALAPNTSVAEVNNGDFRYYIVVRVLLEPALPPLTSSVSLLAFQITCQD